MKKRYVLKKEIKEKLQDILFVGAIVGVLVLCFYGLNALDRHEKIVLLKDVVVLVIS